MLDRISARYSLLWPAASRTDEQKAQAVSQIAASESTEWERVVLADGSKGPIVAEVSIERVRENRDKKPGTELWLIIRRLETGKLKYYLSNAPKDIPHEELKRALDEVYSKIDSLKDNIVVIGGGEAGVETAMHIAGKGRNVTVLEMSDILAPKSTPVHYYSMFWEAWEYI